MRPVTKLAPGEYTDKNGSAIEIKDDYPRYQDAKSALVFNLGMFCSYCEEAYHQMRDLHVEHVQPKNYEEHGRKIYAHLETKWTNFLLSCETCNGADNKDTKNVILTNCHLPYLNNTYKSLTYKPGGVVEVNSQLTGISYTHAQNLLSLIGLDKTPVTSCPGDTRCKKRSKDWDLAKKYKNKYIKGDTNLDTIIDLVENRGGWSIWFTVFSGHDEVRKALIEEFPGTAKECFDANNHYEPVNRNPKNAIDPV